MKKFIVITFLVMVAFVSQAQVVGGVTSLVNDTTTNVETAYLALNAPVAISGSYTMGILVNGVNASGTATVTAALQVSNDNVTFYNYGSSITLNNAGTVSPYAFEIASTSYRYYRVRCISSGTGVTNLTGEIILKRK